MNNLLCHLHLPREISHDESEKNAKIRVKKEKKTYLTCFVRIACAPNIAVHSVEYRICVSMSVKKVAERKPNKRALSINQMAKQQTQESALG